MDLNVNVTFGVTPALSTLVEQALTSALAPKPDQAPTPEPAPAPIPAPTPAPMKQEPQKTEKAKPAEKAKPVEKAPLPEHPTPEQENLMTIQPDSTTVLTEGDIRQAIDLTYIRLEGEDFKEQIAKDPKKMALHKMINQTFRRIAENLAGTRPSKLPEDKRPAFVAACREIFINEEGQPDCKAPY